MYVCEQYMHVSMSLLMFTRMCVGAHVPVYESVVGRVPCVAMSIYCTVKPYLIPTIQFPRLAGQGSKGSSSAPDCNISLLQVIMRSMRSLGGDGV